LEQNMIIYLLKEYKEVIYLQKIHLS